MNWLIFACIGSISLANGQRGMLLDGSGNDAAKVFRLFKFDCQFSPFVALAAATLPGFRRSPNKEFIM